MNENHIAKHNIHTYFMHSNTGLPTPQVAVYGATTAVAGEQHVLTCNVTVVDHLTSSAVLSVQWLGDSVDSSEVQQTSPGAGVGSILTFNPLRTTHGGNHICQATVYIPFINLHKVGSDNLILTVQRKRV